MNRKNLIELMAAVAATAALCGVANAATPQHTGDKLGATRNAWAQCIRAAIPRLDNPQASSNILATDVVARAVMKACSDEYTKMMRALASTLAPTCARDSNCTRRALAKAQREAKQAATHDVVTARVGVAGEAALECE